MCLYSICIDLEHLQLFSRDRTGITNEIEGSLCYFNEGTSLVVYLSIVELPLVILNCFNV